MKRWGLIGAAAAVVVAALGVTITASAREDPTEQIGAVSVDQVRMATPSASASSRSQQVEALEQLDGPLTMLGDDPEDFYIGPIELEFGPEAWVMTAGPSEDFDGDGNRERLLTELKGLVGKPVSALVRLDNDGDEANVYRLNDLTFRDSAGGRPPWLSADVDTTDAASWEAVRAAAAGAVGPGALVDELEWQSAGDVAWEVDVISADGREHTVLLDAAARVLDVRLGD